MMGSFVPGHNPYLVDFETKINIGAFYETFEPISWKFEGRYFLILTYEYWLD